MKREMTEIFGRHVIAREALLWVKLPTNTCKIHWYHISLVNKSGATDLSSGQSTQPAYKNSILRKIKYELHKKLYDGNICHVTIKI